MFPDITLNYVHPLLPRYGFQLQSLEWLSRVSSRQNCLQALPSGCEGPK